MSDRPCNRCEFNRLLREYAKNGLHLKLKHDPIPGCMPGGVTVHAVPKGQKAPADWSNDADSFVCWYGELPEKCAC